MEVLLNKTELSAKLWSLTLLQYFQDIKTQYVFLCHIRQKRCTYLIYLYKHLFLGTKFEKHQCSTLCMDDPKYIYESEKQISITKDETLKAFEKLKNFNPLLIPIILGWKRQLTKHKNMGKRSIYYVSPCGRRLRNLVRFNKQG